MLRASHKKEKCVLVLPLPTSVDRRNGATGDNRSVNIFATVRKIPVVLFIDSQPVMRVLLRDVRHWRRASVRPVEVIPPPYSILLVSLAGTPRGRPAREALLPLYSTAESEEEADPMQDEIRLYP